MSAKVGVFSVLLSVSLLPALATAADELPERAQDLRYGSTLFEYYQGRSFEALTLLNVAKERGGIVGHGEHPKLVEGGLMLSYGMTREAKAHFEAVLVDEMKDRISPAVRNQAWFYLGKVFYLEQDAMAASSALEHVDIPLLQESDTALYEELLYLRAQLALLYPTADANNGLARTMSLLEQLPADSLWRAYVRYNMALKLAEVKAVSAQEPLNSQQQGSTSAELEVLAQDLALAENWRVDDEAERLELLARTRLSLAQGYLQAEDYDAAMRHLKAINLDSVFSDEALFHYAVAASHQGQYGLSLEALNHLKSRTLFTPWLQQVPYALGYLYEQLDDLNLASQAYQSAADHYESLISDLKQKSDGLTEARIIAALAVRGEFDLDKGVGTDAEPVTERELELGVSTIDNDAYGRIHVRPLDFEIAQLLSSESFQLGLRDLHELYKLKSSLAVWTRQLSSFELMLQTRDQQRENKLSVTQAALRDQHAEHWQQQQANYSAAIKAATENEDISFFMDEEQLEFKAQIQDVLENLKGLPNGEDKAEYAAKIQRIKAYFDWWIADRYSVNRWAAQKQLNALNHAMDEFDGRHQTLSQELASTSFQQGMRDRVVKGQQDLEQLSAQLEEALVSTRQALLDLVREELFRQQSEVQQYRLAARHAHARISDMLYQQAIDETTSDENVVGEEESQIPANVAAPAPSAEGQK